MPLALYAFWLGAFGRIASMLLLAGETYPCDHGGALGAPMSSKNSPENFDLGHTRAGKWDPSWNCPTSVVDGNMKKGNPTPTNMHTHCHMNQYGRAYKCIEMPPIYINNCWFKRGTFQNFPSTKRAWMAQRVYQETNKITVEPGKYTVTNLLTTNSTHAQIKTMLGLNLNTPNLLLLESSQACSAEFLIDSVDVF